jgi:SAM-dependent methyltransferase
VTRDVGVTPAARRLDARFDAEWRARFERFAQAHAEEHHVSGWSADGLRQRARLLERLAHRLPLPPRARVLELGCGAGTHVRLLAGLGHAVLGVDYSVPTLRRAVRADPGGTAAYVAAEGYRLAVRTASLDAVVCVGVLQAVADPDRLLAEIVRALRPGGIAVIEALNAAAIAARAGALAATLARRPPRVRYYAPRAVAAWLRRLGLEPRERLAVHVPPRRAPWLGRVLDAPALGRVFEWIPGAPLAMAHAFWFVATKPR